jgi:hypothetical protein
MVSSTRSHFRVTRTDPIRSTLGVEGTSIQPTHWRKWNEFSTEADVATAVQATLKGERFESCTIFANSADGRRLCTSLNANLVAAESIVAYLSLSGRLV